MLGLYISTVDVRVRVRVCVYACVCVRACVWLSSFRSPYFCQQLLLFA